MFAPEPQRLQLAPRIALAIIDATVAAHLGTTRVTGNAQPAAFNRQVAMYLAKHVGGWSTTRIGKFYNGRDHSTVCYALKRIEALRQADSDVDALLANLTNQIRSAPLRLSKVHKQRPSILAWYSSRRPTGARLPRRTSSTAPTVLPGGADGTRGLIEEALQFGAKMCEDRRGHPGRQSPESDGPRRIP
jgi:hypothetical protein